MKPTENYRRQHNEIVDIARKIEAGIAPGKLPAGTGDMRGLMTTLAGKLNVHLAMEDDALYPRLKDHSDPKVRELATRFSTEMSTIKPVVQSYMTKWSDAGIRANPTEFTSDTKKLLGALADRIQRENNELYVAVDNAG